ncbi:MAG: phasin family protein [Ectothiorhodospiraceae bacterium]|jgi:phasin family protein
MYEELFNKANVSFDQFVGPARKFNALVVDNMEKVAKFQFDAVKSYADLGIRNVREGLEVKDAKSFQDYVTSRGELVQTFGEKLQEDARAFADMGQDFGQQLQKLVQENVQTAAAAAPKPAKKTGASASTGASRKSA